MAKEDLARETAHQQGSDWNSLAVTDAQIEDVLKVHRVRPVWHLDGLPEPGSKHYPAQTFVAAAEAIAPSRNIRTQASAPGRCSSTGPCSSWMVDVLISVSVRGTTVGCDERFRDVHRESFEGLAQRGFVNSVVQFVSELCPSGGSSATVTAECP